MKKTILTLAVAMITTISAFAQIPQAFNYQGIARDNVGNELTYQKISLQVSILQGSSTGSSVYIETHIDTTNEFGLFNLEIGGGSPVSGDFATINWGGNTHYLKVEMDATGGTSYQFMGTSQLLSVPYALYAGAAPGSSAQTLSFSGDTLSISSGNFVVIIDNVDDADADPTNELQAISISNDTLLLSNGGTVYLGNYLDNTDNQTLSLAGDTLSISSGNFVVITDNVDDADADSTNELQILSISGSDLTISSGNTLTLPATAPSDTSLYSYDAGWADSADYANDAGWADSADYANDAGFADTADYAYDAGYADTADFAWNVVWDQNGDTIYYNDGNVGIGTTTPDTTLHIVGSLKIVDGTQDAGKVLTSDANGLASWQTVAGAPDADWTIDADTLYSAADSTITIKGGNVGIGTTTPDTTLHIVGSLKIVDGTQDAGKVLTSDANGLASWQTVAGAPDADWTIAGGDTIYHLTGNVGIGTTGPTSLLHLKGNGPKLSLENITSGATAESIAFIDNTGTQKWDIRRFDSNDKLQINSYNGGFNTRLSIDNTGNVGIGTTSPSAKLEIKGSTSGFGSSALNVTNSVGTSLLYVSDGGNVGIGAAGPGTKLDIDGALSVRGMAAPAVSLAVQGRIYFDSGANKFKVSENAGAYVDLVGGGGSNWTLSGTDIYNSNSGNVGIGTTSPATKLDIAGNFIQSASAYHNFGSTVGSTGYGFRDNTGTMEFKNNAGSWAAFGSGGGQWSDAGTYIYANNSTNVVVTDAGNVGIGTTTPGARLDIVGSVLWGNPAAAQGTLDYGTIVVVGSKTNYPLRLVTNDIERVLIDIAGNVGIGTASPGTKLDIDGALSVRGMASPAVSPAVQGRIYFDSGTNKFKVSENGGAYVDLVGGGGSNWTLSGTDIYNSNSGNVGIGTTTPSSLLHVYGTSGPFQVIIENGSGNFKTGYTIKTALNEWFIGQESTSASGFRITDIDASAVRLQIDETTGNVGIGTTTPSSLLHVYGTSDPLQVIIENGGGNFNTGYTIKTALNEWFIGQESTSASGFRITDIDASAVRLQIDEITGNVGIGTTSPAEKLEISGTVKATAFEGFNSTASGANSAALGNVTIASGNYATALGWSTTASGEAATAMGFGTLASNGYATAMGFQTTASGGNSLASGKWVTAGDLNAIVLGQGVSNATRLVNNTASSLMVGFNSDIPTLFVGPSAGTGTSGNVGIGTTAPGAKLQVEGNMIVNGDISRTDNTYLKISNNGTLDRPIIFDIRGTERMRVNSDGNVGIGTTAPGALLDIGPSTTGLSLRVTNTNSASGIAGYFNNTSATNTSPALQVQVVNTAAPSAVFTGGNVGIGTTSPTEKLHILGNGFEKILVETTTSTRNAVVDLKTTGGVNDYLRLVKGGPSTSGSTAGILLANLSQLTAGANAGSLLLQVITSNPMHFVTGNVERMRITATGNVGIGTVTPSEKLHVVGNICYTGSISACSDIRYKKSITPLNNSLNKILQIEGVNYYWKTKKFPEQNFNKDKQIGLIAQEVEEIYPELVRTDNDGYKTIDYSRLTPILIEAIKEQQKIIENLQAENKESKGDIEGMKAEIIEMKSVIGMSTEK